MEPKPRQIVEALREALTDSSEQVWYQAAISFAPLGSESSEVIEILLNGVQHAQYWSVRRECANLLGQIATYDKRVLNILLLGLIDDDNDVRTACARALARLGQRYTEATEEIAETLIQAIQDPKFEKVDEIEDVPGYDYAFDSLWMLIVNEEAGTAGFEVDITA